MESVSSMEILLIYGMLLAFAGGWHCRGYAEEKKHSLISKKEIEEYQKIIKKLKEVEIDSKH